MVSHTSAGLGALISCSWQRKEVKAARRSERKLAPSLLTDAHPAACADPRTSSWKIIMHSGLLQLHLPCEAKASQVTTH